MHPLDHVRQLLVSRAKEKRLSLADLSRGIGKNPAYVHQYIHKGSPRVLPEDVRLTLAQLLELPPDDLHHNPALRRETLAAASELPSPRDLPVYADGHPLDREHVVELINRPPLLAGLHSAFAIWISRPGGRLLVGDLAYVHPHQPPRPGDTVIAVVDGLPAAGALVALEGGTAEVDLGDSIVSLDRSDAFRVVGALFG